MLFDSSGHDAPHPIAPHAIDVAETRIREKCRMHGQRDIMIVGRGVIEEAFNFFFTAVTGLATELEPPVPVQAMIRFRLTPNLVSETETTLRAQQCPNASIELRLVHNVMEADRADDKIERIFW